ncbi:MAG TPA: hypothetical protein VKI99_19085 [Candidatus Dormibacteraeota bacterium]|nr:hypothetical protein [Candidatus Dormibacteraeota bacterium]
MISAQSPIWRRAPPPQLWLAVGGVAATAAVLSASDLSYGLPLRDLVRVPGPGRIILIASAGAVLLTTGLAPHRISRWQLLGAGLGAVGAMAVLVAITDPLAVALLLILVGFGWATRRGGRPLAIRVRGPAFAALLLGVGWAFHGTTAPEWLGRAAALSLALSLVAAAGLFPYLQQVDPDEPAGYSYLAWTGFFAPALALTLPYRLLPALTPDQATVFGATLVGLGLLNLGWGVVGAWRTDTETEAWRCSFLADWGLVMVGTGLFQADGLAAAYLALLAIVLVRLPLYLWARPALLQREFPAVRGPVSVLVAVLLAGAAPFSGFPVRLLLLQAATRTGWPLAVLLLAGMVLWIAHSLRLARTVGSPRGRGALGLWLTVVISLILGMFSGTIRAAAGL